MSKLVENNPKIAEAHRLRGDYLLATRQAKRRSKRPPRRSRLAPDDAETIVLAARCNLALRKLDHGASSPNTASSSTPTCPILPDPLERDPKRGTETPRERRREDPPAAGRRGPCQAAGRGPEGRAARSEGDAKQPRVGLRRGRDV